MIMYGFDLSKVNDIERIVNAKSVSGPIKIGNEYVVSVPVDDGGNSVFFGEIVKALDITDGGFSFQFQVYGNPNRIVVIPAAVAVVALVNNE